MSYSCKYCKNTDEKSFFENNRSSCKKCISCRNKIKRKTVKPNDDDCKIFCLKTGLDFNKLCQESEEKKLTVKLNDPTPTIKPISLPSTSIKPISPTLSIQPTEIDSLKTITELTAQVKYLEEILLSNIDFNERGFRDLTMKNEEDDANKRIKHRELEAKFQKIEEEQKGKYKLLEEKYNQILTHVNDNSNKNKELETETENLKTYINVEFYTKQRLSEKVNGAIDNKLKTYKLIQ